MAKVIETGISKETGLKLFQAAEEFMDLAPWEWMEDSDLFGVADPASGEIGYCCVLGSLGQVLGLVVYQGREGLAAYMDLQGERFEERPEELIYRQKCLMVSFEDRSELAEPDLALIRQLGLKYRGHNAWPQFRSYNPGYAPWFLTETEACFMAVALEQAVIVCRQAEGDPGWRRQARKGHCRVRILKGGEWGEQWLKPGPLPEKPAPAVPLNQLRLHALRKQRRIRQGVWEMGAFPMMTAVHEKKGERPYFPYLMLCVDQGSGVILHQDMGHPECYLDIFGESLLDFLEECPCLPRQILVEDELLLPLLLPLGAALDIPVEETEDLERLEMAKDAMLHMSFPGEPMDVPSPGPVARAWSERFRQASLPQRYGLLKETLSQPVSPQFLQETSLPLYLSQMVSTLENHNQLEMLQELAGVIQAHNREFYRIMAPVIDPILIQYALCQGSFTDGKAVARRLARDLAPSRHHFMVVLYAFSLHGQRDAVEEMCREVMAAVMGGHLDDEFLADNAAYQLMMRQIQQVYERLRAGQEVDWKEVTGNIRKIGFSRASEMVEEIGQWLGLTMNDSNHWLKWFEKDRRACLSALEFNFCKQMHDRKQMAFTCSHLLWQELHNFLEINKPQGKSGLVNYFKVQAGPLEAYLFGEEGGAEIRETVLLWGSTYVFDFLLASRLISPAQHGQAIKNLEKFKGPWQELNENQLWKFSFISQWMPPDSLAEGWCEDALLFSGEGFQPFSLGSLLDPEDLQIMDQMVEMASQFMEVEMGTDAEPFNSDGAGRARQPAVKKRRQRRRSPR